MVVARQLAERWGFDVVADGRCREELVQPVRYPEDEWLVREWIPEPGRGGAHAGFTAGAVRLFFR